jgi:hypothetical protein
MPGKCFARVKASLRPNQISARAGVAVIPLRG